MSRSKKVMVWIGIAVVAVAVVLMTVFLLKTRDLEKEENLVGSNSLTEGKWLITIIADVPIKNSYWQVGKDAIEYYKDGGSAPSAVSKYSEKDGHLTLDDMNKIFALEPVTDKTLKLTETDTATSWVLLKAPVSNEFDKDMIWGDWNVISHAGTRMTGETIRFDGSIMSNYRDNNVNASFEGRYTWNDSGNIYVNEMNLEFQPFAYGNDRIALLEISTGRPWELERIK